MHRFFPLSWMVLLCALLATGDRGARGSEPIVVRLASGREFRAHVDRATDATTLWLRFGEGAMVIRRPVSWGAVEAAFAGEHAIGVAQLRGNPQPFCHQPAVRTAGGPLPESAAKVAAVRQPIEVLPAPREWRPLQPAPPAFVQPGEGPVRSIVIDATIANWNASVEADGLLVSVAALDEYGAAVPCQGTLSVELFTTGPGTLAHWRTFPTIGRWAQSVRLDPANPASQYVKLAFQAIHPEYDQRVSYYGMVHATLAVPGHGVFESTTNMTRIRASSPTRDRRQQLFHQRYFPTERTSRGKYDMPWMWVRS